MKRCQSIIIGLFLFSTISYSQKPADVSPELIHRKGYKTYCNPIDIDYSYMSHYRASNNVSYRSGADPEIVNFKGQYYLFVTRSLGYWMSDDMNNWKFIEPQSWYFNGSNAHAAAVKDGKIIVLGDPSGRSAVIETDNPEFVTGKPIMLSLILMKVFRTPIYL